MAHRCLPSSTFTWNRLRRSYRLGAVSPSRRCCSTEAGSVSPCTTIRRWRLGRALAGDLLPGRLALVLAEPDPPVWIPFGQEDPPPVVGQPDPVEVRPPG